MRTVFYGVDFSGAKNAASLIYVSKATVHDDQLSVEYVRPLEDLCDAATRQEAHTELRGFIAERPGSVFGLDFPFALPECVVEQDNWMDFLNWFQSNHEMISPEVFTEIHTAKGDGHKKRERDIRFGGQSPYGLQIRYQTFYGIRDVIAPLAINQQASVLPMQAKRDDLPWVIEVYPAGTLGTLGLYRTQYKNNSEAHQDRRKKNIEGLTDQGVCFEREADRETAIKNDNALDSIGSLFATYRVQSRHELSEHNDCVEGHMFV